MPLSCNGLGKIFAAGGRAVGTPGHSWPVVNEPPPVPLNSAGPCRRTNRLHFDLPALMSLNAADDLEQVADVGIAGRSEHAHQTLGRLVREGVQLPEPDGGVDVTAQHNLARIHVSCQQALDAFLTATLLEMPGRVRRGAARSL